ncbi:MAG: hypothetical protein ACLFVP_05135 [Candidatus Bathyarchaeia archaeon]
MSEKLRLSFDLSGEGLGMVFKDYEVLALEAMWEDPDHLFSSYEVSEAVNEKLSTGVTRSRGPR